MHDDLLERRLSASLREEAASLPFNITAAELERRVALRRRSLAGRRLTLLLAAAVGISLFGIGGALSGLLNQPKPQSTSPAVVTEAQPWPSTGSDGLPSLDDLVAIDPESVLIAQAHGLALGPPYASGRPRTEPSSVQLITLGGGSKYDITIACMGPARLEMDIRPALDGGPASGPTLFCDGFAHEEVVDSREARSVGFRLTAEASWRVVVRGTPTYTQPLTSDPRLAAPAGQEELVRVDDVTVGAGGQQWGARGLEIQDLGEIPARETYSATSWCSNGSPMRYVLGDVVRGAIVPDTETFVSCRPGVVRDTSLGIAQPFGSNVFIAATPGQRVSLLVTSPTAPVSLTQQLPGWRISGAVGPAYEFGDTRLGLSGAGLGEDHIQVVFACVGDSPIVVVVDDGSPIGSHGQQFEAACAPRGTTTTRVFSVTEQGVSVSYLAPRGSWTALSILVPSN